MISLKKRPYNFVGKVKDLANDIQEEIESREMEEIEQGFKENCCCDNFGYCCGASCKYYASCKM